MLEQARQRALQAGWSNIRFIREDAVELKHIEGQFDAVLSVWCLGIVYELPAALHRIFELTRPDGRIVILDFAQSQPDRGILRLLYPIYRWVLVTTGIDAPDDIDDGQLRSRWREGRALLHELLPDLVEERFMGGGGVLFHGTRPRTDL